MNRLSLSAPHAFSLASFVLPYGFLIAYTRRMAAAFRYNRGKVAGHARKRVQGMPEKAAAWPLAIPARPGW
jgi:hypothetical protein